MLVAAGRRIDPGDLPALLIGLADGVIAGTVSPAQAASAAACVRTAVQVAAAAAWDTRLAAIETAVAAIERAGLATRRPVEPERES